MNAIVNFLRSKTTQTVAGSGIVAVTIAELLMQVLGVDDPAVKAAGVTFIGALLTAGLGRLVAWIRGKL